MPASEEWASASHVGRYLDRAHAEEQPVGSAQALLEHVPADARRILDLGTGDGRVLALLLADSRKRSGVGLDFSELMLDAARERFRDDARVELVRHDLSAPLPALGRFDAVVSSLAIHHLEHERKRTLYAEAFGLLEPGGLFANFDHVASPSRRLHLEFFAAIDEPLEYEDPSDRLLDVHTQLQWLRELGFEDVDCHWKWRELALLAGVKPPARRAYEPMRSPSVNLPTDEAWEARAGEWATWARTPGNDPFYDLLNLPAFLALLPPAGRMTVDVGCGEGRLARTLSRLGHTVIGVDSSPTLAELARTADGLHEVLHARADSIPLPGASADLVVAFMSLQDMDEIEGPLDEAARVLGRGGVLCVAVPHPFAEIARARAGDEDYFSAHRYADVIEHDGAEMTFESWRRPLSAYSEALERSGFTIDAIREPIPDDAALAAVPRLAKWRTRPVFLHLRASLR